MLRIEDFAKQVQDRLNTIASDYEGAIPFKIYTNLGDYVQAYRVLNDVEQYQYGIMRVLPSEIVPVKGLSVQNLVIQIEFGVEIDKSELDDDGNYLQVVYAQKILNEYAQSTTGTTETITGLDDKDYTIAYGINPCTVGSVTMTSSDKGEVLPIQITIDVSAVENGVNLNDIDVFIDGEAVYPLSMQATRKRVPNENSFSNKTSTSVGMLQNGFGLDLIVPALYNKIGETILDDIYIGKDNVAHEVSIQRPKWLTYLIYDNANYDNMMAKYSYYEYSEQWVTVIEDDEEVEKLQGKLKFQVTTTLANQRIQLYHPSGTGNNVTYKWGDNSEGTLYYHTYTEAKDYDIEIIISDVSDYPANKFIIPRQYNYIMTFGNTDHNTAINTNINPHISLVEGISYLLEYNDEWKFSSTVTYNTTTTAHSPIAGSSVYHTYKPGTYTRIVYRNRNFSDRDIIFWGDGTFDISN